MINVSHIIAKMATPMDGHALMDLMSEGSKKTQIVVYASNVSEAAPMIIYLFIQDHSLLKGEHVI